MPYDLYCKLDLTKIEGSQLVDIFMKTIPSSANSLDLSDNNLYERIRDENAEFAKAIAAIHSGVGSLAMRGTNLHLNTGAQLSKVFASIPKTINSLDLSKNMLGQMNSDELVTALKSIPASVHSLHLNENNLHRKTAAELEKIFASIPAGVSSLSLTKNFIGNMRGDDNDLSLAIMKIPRTVTSLDLSDNNLYQLEFIYLAGITASIPDGVVSLDLSCNSLVLHTAEQLAFLFKNIPANVKTLNLSSNELNQKTPDELAKVLAAIRASVTSLDLGHNGLDSYNGAGLAEIIASIPAGVTELNLSCNDLFCKSGAELAQAFARLPPSINSLNLSGNGLCLKDGVELAKALAAIPRTVTSLNLSEYGQFGGVQYVNIATLFVTIPVGVSYIDLSSIGLFEKTGDELAKAFAAIPINVTSINLSSNGLGMKTADELAAVFAAIPAHIKSINLENNDLFTNKSAVEKDKILKALGNNRERFILTNNGESDLARALAPMVALRSKTTQPKLPSEIVGHILSFLPTDRKIHRSNFFYKQLKDTETKIEHIRENRIREGANVAIDKYLNWLRHEIDQTGLLGSLIRTLSGTDESYQARKLKGELKGKNPKEVIEQFLNHPKTPNHSNSLASFLRAELSKIKESPGENTNKNPDYKP